MESISHEKNDVDAQSVGTTEAASNSPQGSDINIKEPEIGSSNSKESKRKRKTNVTETEIELFFRLFKYINVKEEYMLEAHQVRGGVSRYYIKVFEESNNKWQIKVEEVAQRNHVVTAVLQDPTPLVFPKKYDILLEERLKGWTMEIRTRSNGKNQDTYYRHQHKQFRSLREMVIFILYSTDLKLILAVNKK